MIEAASFDPLDPFRVDGGVIIDEEIIIDSVYNVIMILSSL